MVQYSARAKHPYVIRVSSYKGGVGKTVISVNLAAALRAREYNVLLIDADTSNPSVGFHLGMEKTTSALSEWLKSGAHLKDVVATHGPTGLDVVNEAINRKPYLLTDSMIERMGSELRGSGYDFVIIDTSPGYNLSTTQSDFISEVLAVMVPTRPAYSSAVKLIEDVDRHRITHSVIVNMVRNKKYELRLGEITETFPGEAVFDIPYDEIVMKAVGEKIPAYELDENAPFSKAIDNLASKYSGRVGYSYPYKKSRGILTWILDFIFRRS